MSSIQIEFNKVNLTENFNGRPLESHPLHAHMSKGTLVFIAFSGVSESKPSTITFMKIIVYAMVIQGVEF